MTALRIVFCAIVSLTCRGQPTISPSSGTLSVKEGEDAYFTCTGSGPHLLQVNSNVTADRFTWDNDGSGTFEYYLNDTVREDNGTTLQCFFNGEGSTILTLIIDFAPRYEPTESTYRVIEGSSPQLLLNVELPTPGIQPVWTKDGVTINTTSRLSLHTNGLVFSRVTKEDAGIYVVQATDSAGTGTATINVEVYYGPVFTEGSGVVSKTVMVGGDIALSCSVNGNPAATLEPLTYNGPESNVLTVGSEFRITSAVLGNAGQYTCMARNSVAERELTFNLTVTARVQSSTSTVPVPTISPSMSPSMSPGSGADTFGNMCTLLLSLSLLVGMVFTL